jgi:hypothetical protein
MEELGIPEKFVRLTKSTLRTVKCKVKFQNDFIRISTNTHWFATGRQFSM